MAKIASVFSNFYSISRCQQVEKNEKYIDIYKGQLTVCELLTAEKKMLYSLAKCGVEQRAQDLRLKDPGIHLGSDLLSDMIVG